MNQKSLGCLAGLLCLASIGTTVNGAERSTCTPTLKPEKGEFGGDLNFLRRYYTPPHHPGESNHYFDLWNGTTMPAVARVHGLTNNRALFIDSHGRGDVSFLRTRYAYYPHRDLLPRGQRPPYFSARDLAKVVGAAAAEIHNIIIGGCDAEGGFDPRELRKYFVNATNIVHTVPGEDGFKPMFYAAIVNPSSANKPLYATRGTKRDGEVAYHLSERPSPEAELVKPYLASLFRPGEIEPYHTQVAGQELLEPVATRFRPRSRSNELRLAQSHLMIQIGRRDVSDTH